MNWPNRLSLLRVGLVPLVVLMICLGDPWSYGAALVLFLAGCLTDWADGWMARRYRIVTNFGKFMDPVADKLTEGAVVLCLMTRYRWVAALVVLYVLKEGFMAVAGLVMLRRGKKLDGAKWFGKVCTFVFYLVTVTLILWVSIPPTVADILIAVCGAVMAFTLAMYIPVFVKMNREAKADAGEK